MALTLHRQCHIRRPAANGGVLDWVHDHRCHRSPRFLFAAPRHRGAAADQSRHSGRWPDAEGQRVLGLGYPTPYLGLFREDSERCIAFMPAAQGVLKWPTGAAGAGDIGRRIFAAAAGCRGRSHPAGSCAGNVRRSRRTAARGVAGAGAVGPDDGGHSEPPRGVDAHRHHAVRSRPALFALADHAIAAADLVHADGVGRGAVHAAGRAAAGSCARRWHGSASAPRCRCRSPACISWKRPSRSIARSRRTANARG